MALVTMEDTNGLSSALTLAAGGDQYAFGRIVAAHHDDMARVAYVVCRDVDLAQEAVQEAWSVAWRQLPSCASPSASDRGPLPSLPTRRGN